MIGAPFQKQNTASKPGNNKLCFFGDELEQFSKSCKRLMDRIKHVLPEGCPRARIRATARSSRKLDTGLLGETLGKESSGIAAGRKRGKDKGLTYYV